MKLPGLIRRPLEGERFHVIVVGGGISGVAIARQCARAGRRTLLVEQNDFASGTTSKSTRLLRGGLQFVEQGEIGLLRESLREQQRLLREHPHLIHPSRIVLAVPENSGLNRMRVRAGLWLYRRMATAKSDLNKVNINRFKLERQLDKGAHWSLFDFEDAQCEFPERIVAEWLADAVEAGAMARNHTEVLAVNVFHGKAKGLLMRDLLTGKEDPVEANWIINATGPWVDRLCQRSRIPRKQPLLRGVRGTHIVLPRFPGSPDEVVCTHIGDMPLYVAPWNDQVLVGATAAQDNNDPGSAEPSKDEIEYLFKAFTRVFPKTKYTTHDIRYTYTGIRPQPYTGKNHVVKQSEKCFIHDHRSDGAAQMLSIIGGNLTSAPELGRQCLRMIGHGGRRATLFAALPQSTFDPMLDQWVLDLADVGGISEASARGIAEWFGKRAPAITQLATTSVQMRAQLCPHSPHIVAEAIFALTQESAVTLADVLLRRVPVALGRCWSESCSRDAAMRIAAVVGWNEYETAAELEAFENERSRFLRKPNRHRAFLDSAAD
ncbi:MAG TPA: FAD-dependent oxidoreductase [Terriglobales bacterium]|jgi:glycerol-3-phosphate dehydrogenase